MSGSRPNRTFAAVAKPLFNGRRSRHSAQNSCAIAANGGNEPKLPDAAYCRNVGYSSDAVFQVNGPDCVETRLHLAVSWNGVVTNPTATKTTLPTFWELIKRSVSTSHPIAPKQ